MAGILDAMRAVGGYLPYLLSGLELTLLLSVFSLIGSTLGGMVLAVLRMSPVWFLRWPAALYVDLVRMIPLVMVIFWIFFLIPILTGQAVTPTLAALAALITFNSSYMAEVIRAGIQAVPRGLGEAARCGGMSYVQCMRHVILPIAVRNMLPALVNRLVALVMGTSLASIIGVTEFFRASNDVNNRLFLPYTVFTMVAAVYFILCFTLSVLSRILERRLSLGQRLPAEDLATSS